MKHDATMMTVICDLCGRAVWSAVKCGQRIIEEHAECEERPATIEEIAPLIDDIPHEESRIVRIRRVLDDERELLDSAMDRLRVLHEERERVEAMRVALRCATHGFDANGSPVEGE